MLALFYTIGFSVAVWLMLYSESLAKGQLTIQAIIALTTAVACNLALALFIISRST